MIAAARFPLGTSPTKAKVKEAKQAIKDGADEIDIVINLEFLKSELTKSAKRAIACIKAGATRIGTSNGVAIVYEAKKY